MPEYEGQEGLREHQLSFLSKEESNMNILIKPEQHQAINQASLA